MTEMACPIDGWADHPWWPFHLGPSGMGDEAVCSVYGCYYLEARHEQPTEADVSVTALLKRSRRAS